MTATFGFALMPPSPPRRRGAFGSLVLDHRILEDVAEGGAVPVAALAGVQSAIIAMRKSIRHRIPPAGCAPCRRRRGPHAGGALAPAPQARDTPAMPPSPQDEARAALDAAGQLPDAELDIAAIAVQFAGWTRRAPIGAGRARC